MAPPVRLSDVAKVTDGVEDRFNSGYFNTDSAVLLIVSRQPDANIIETVDAITAQMPALRAFLPGGVELHVASDRSPAIRSTLHEAERSLLIAVALVIVVVLLFLANVRAALIPVAAVPVSLIGSFAVMYLWGFSLNSLSLMALDRRHRAGRRRRHRRPREHLAPRRARESRRSRRPSSAPAKSARRCCR